VQTKFEIKGFEMDFLKWCLKASFVVALMFLGLEAESGKDNNEKEKSGASTFARLF